MSAIKTYLEQIQTEQGLRRQGFLRNLRWYIKASKYEDLKKAINLITDINQLKILWEAGLDSDLQEVVLRRTRDLTERRRT